MNLRDLKGEDKGLGNPYKNFSSKITLRFFKYRLILLRITIPKFMKIRQLSNFENECKNVKINMFKMDVLTIWLNYKVATLTTVYLNVLGIIIPSLKLIGQFYIPKLINQKAKNSYA